MKKVKLLGNHIYGNFNFDCHIKQLCKRVSKTLHALARIC